MYKIFPNLGKLDFEEREVVIDASPNKLKPPSPHLTKPAAEKANFMVNGAISLAGEKLELSKPLPYQGPMSQWLPRLIESLKCSLQVR